MFDALVVINVDVRLPNAIGVSTKGQLEIPRLVECLVAVNQLPSRTKIVERSRHGVEGSPIRLHKVVQSILHHGENPGREEVRYPVDETGDGPAFTDDLSLHLGV